ncbi:MAG TPA: MBL fold metallo-hydrolase [candidate division Zixibacteria bacterium]|jgi:L-ascorbate metabolism protein UlaG (beta-lactamase superfamily)|nr:MBL fold metallo-hydrolase [candidate division Zixibacteria bacterium]
MKLRYLAHSAFLLTTSKGTRIITDPYEAGSYGGAVGYRPIEEEADAITVSHDHPDHCHVCQKHREAKLIEAPGEHRVAEVEIRGVPTYHDQAGGQERGKNIMFVYQADGVRVCHCGDLGHVLDDKHVKELGPVDVLLLPVGGFYTIDAAEADQVIAKVKPRVAVPMHYKTEKLGFGIATVEPFVNGKNNVINIGESEVEIDAAKLARGPEVWVLRPCKL